MNIAFKSDAAAYILSWSSTTYNGGIWEERIEIISLRQLRVLRVMMFF